MSIPITRLEKWSYQKEHEIFSVLYKTTGKTTWIRIPALIATEKCTLIRTAALAGTIARLAFNGLRLTLNPYQSSDQRQHGWILLKNVRYKALDLIGDILFGIVIGPIWISIDSKFYILLFAERAKVDWIHAEAGTIDTKAHDQALEATFSEAKHGQEKWKNQPANNT
ncbi:hypothetical protein [Candidatus Rhabdochlamydia sp. T3358]|uniref:hypothetical protein n=1 Tax=Candidatus Rhabdochlamydia sp. T3358 TaxID=2099795 RepID=UPI0010BC00AD|nr:hypothetical protein [Candidatus Rhabdochlamydia sp. T3358]VHO03602.1 hypothetical protein RHT_00966 [Candidatus Rhabdochlamydia sp. T3358]